MEIQSNGSISTMYNSISNNKYTMNATNYIKSHKRENTILNIDQFNSKSTLNMNICNKNEDINDFNLYFNDIHDFSLVNYMNNHIKCDIIEVSPSDLHNNIQNINFINTFNLDIEVNIFFYI